MWKIAIIPLSVLVLLTSCISGSSEEVQLTPALGQPTETVIATDFVIEAGEEFPWPDDVPRPPEPNPINLNFTPEENNTVTVLIQPEAGGTLSVVSQTGVIFTLIIPPDALLGPEKVSMTPLSLIEGVPYGQGKAMGVKLEPEGLVFVDSAELSIEMPAGRDLSDAFGFATFADGEDFHLTPWEIDGGTIRLSVSHFSVSALKEVGYSQIDASETRYAPSNGQAVFEDAWARVQDASTEGGPVVAAAAELGLKTWFYSTVLPQLTKAIIDTDELDRATEEVLRWNSWIRGDPRFDDELGLLWKSLGLAFANAFVKAQFLCVAGNAPEQAIRMIRWLGIMDALQPKNSDGSFVPGYLHGIANREGVINFIESCFRFSLEFRSRIEMGQQEGKFIMQLALLRPLKISFDAERLKIQESNVALPYEFFDIQTSQPLPPQCSLSTKPGNVTMKLLATANVNYKMTGIEDLWLEFIFNQKPQEVFDCGSLRDFTNWHANFSSAHEITDVQQRIMVQMKIIRTESAFAIYEFDGQSAAKATESTDIKLIHTPGVN